MLTSTEIKQFFSERQAFSRRQLLNHAAHAGVLLLVAIPFLAGRSLPPRAQYAALAILGFLVKEGVEMERRRLLGEPIHRADSAFDFTIAVLVIMGAGIFLGPRGAAIIGGGLTGLYAYLRWGRGF